MAKYCVRCGTKNHNNAAVCSGCGISLSGVSTESSRIPGKVEEAAFALQEADTLNHSHDLIQNKIILQEIQCQNDFMYVLDARADFSLTEYKVLNSSGDRGMLQCSKILYNGKNTLYYMGKENYKPLETVLPTLGVAGFMCILENLLTHIDMIKSNGFLQQTGIDVRMNRIYVNPYDGQVRLTYVPTNYRCYSDAMYMEYNLREDLLKIMNSVKSIPDRNFELITRMLDDASCSFNSILSAIRQNWSASVIGQR